MRMRTSCYWFCGALLLAGMLLAVPWGGISAESTWQDAWHDASNTKFAFRCKITLVNLLDENRTQVPIELHLTFPDGQCCLASLRVVRELNGIIYQEVPYQNFSLIDTNGNGYLEGVTLRFLADLPNSTVDQGFGPGRSQYWVYWTYSTTMSAPSYTYPNVTGPPITAFNDSTPSKTVYFPEPGNRTVYLRIPKNCHILSSNLSLRADYHLVEVATLNNGGSRNHGVCIGDVDNDGLNEIIGGRNDGEIHFWDWNRTGYEMKPAYTDAGTSAYGLFVADTNQNGTQDLVIGSGTGKEMVYEWLNFSDCLLYTSPSPRDLSTSRMPSSA